MRSFIKAKAYFILLLMLMAQALLAQGNCALMEEGSKERIACEYGKRAITFKQGSRQSQLLFDSAIAINPEYAWAYYEKSVPYFKRGMLSEGIRLLNKAVDLDPLSYLTYRAYWFSQHRSYSHCRDDLEAYYAMEGAYDKSTPDGALDMRIFLGIVYSELGFNQRALNQVEQTIKEYPSEAYQGPYDYHTLGVLYLKNKQYAEAKGALERSLIFNSQFADTYYYLSLTEQKLGSSNRAKDYALESLKRFKGEMNGYSGYPLCFPVNEQMALEQLAALEGQQ